MKKRICIISLSLPIETDIRTIKQVEYLAPHFDLMLIGYGNPERVLPFLADWKAIDRGETPTRKLLERGLIFAGRVVPQMYDVWYKQRPRYRQALACARASRSDAFLADDWAAIPIAAQAAERGQPIIFDADEYWPGEVESDRLWKLFFSPMIVHTLNKYVKYMTGSTTVSRPLARRYKEVFGLDPILVYNAPKPAAVEERDIDLDHIRLIHQGSPVPNRRLEIMIDALAKTDSRFTLHLMLTGSQEDPYLIHLKTLANTIAPGRVTFQPPVYPTEIVTTIASYDIGISVIPPATFTYHVALPNKLFESIVAGQPVIVGPSPAMAELVTEYNVGWVTAGFEADDLAAVLNGLTAADINAKRRNAREAAKTLNADVEMQKLVDLFSRLLESSPVPHA